jgi:exodeoxyribonuclease V beta subunit
VSVQAIQASAGTGKTFAICDRVLHRVSAGAPIAELAVVSFTEAAAADLRRRVRMRLQDARELATTGVLSSGETPDNELVTWAATAGEPEVDNVTNALADLDLAPITTVHGLCSRLLRSLAFESGAPLDADIGAGSNAADQVVGDLTRSLTAELDPLGLLALQELGLHGKALRDLARTAMELELQVRPEQCTPADAPDLGPWHAAVDALREAWTTDGRAMAELMVARTALRSTDGGKLGKLAGWIYTLGLVGGVPAEVHQLLGPGYRGKVPEHEPLFEKIDAVLDLLETTGQAYERWATWVRWDVVQRVRDLARQTRQRTAAMSFDDLVRQVRDAAVDPQRGPVLRKAIADRFRIALVDEAQDNDPVQWTLLLELFGDRLVVVGDPKQSIYAFRRANVHAWSQVVDGSAETLGVNYRSDARLVRATNHLFGRWKQPFAGAPATYDRVDPFHPENRTSDPSPPLHIVRMSGQGVGRWKGGVSPWDARPKLAAHAAEAISDLLASNLKIEGRDVRAADCAVLTRTNDECTAVRQALAARGIAAAVRGKESVLELGALREAVATVLEAFQDPAGRGTVSRALATHLVGCTGTQIHTLRHGPKWPEVVERCRHWGEVWRSSGVLAALLGWIEDRSALANLVGRPGGQQEVTDLRQLVQLAHQAEAAQRLSPWGVIRWLRDPSGADEDEGGRRLPTDEDAVHVATLHKAKGLEYGLVWMPFASATVWAKTLRYYDRQAESWILDVRLDPDGGHARLDALQEELRGLYVGVTRAQYRCTVYWLPSGRRGDESALGYLLHRGPGADVDALRREAAARANRAKRVSEDLDALAAHADVGWSDGSLADTPETRLPSTRRAVTMRPLARDRGLDLGWRRASFTSLVKGDLGWLTGEPVPDDDLDDDLDDELAEVEASADRVPLADFPRGAHAGNLMHDVLEHHDFSQDDALRARVEAGLTEHGFDAEQWATTLHDGLHRALHTPIWPEDAFVLANLERKDTLREPEVVLPACGGYSAKGGVTVNALADCFEQELGPGAPPQTADKLRRLTFTTFRGFLNGKIDLVFRRGERFYVLDWKSNHLGDTPEHYAHEAMREAVLRSNYVLQYHLYTLFLHRYLRRRVANYDYDTHMGGVVYAFLRGMQPETGSERGVFRDRPPKALIERLDALFLGAR